MTEVARLLRSGGKSDRNTVARVTGPLHGSGRSGKSGRKTVAEVARVTRGLLFGT